MGSCRPWDRHRWPYDRRRYFARCSPIFVRRAAVVRGMGFSSPDSGLPDGRRRSCDSRRCSARYAPTAVQRVAAVLGMAVSRPGGDRPDEHRASCDTLCCSARCVSAANVTGADVRARHARDLSDGRRRSCDAQRCSTRFSPMVVRRAAVVRGMGVRRPGGGLPDERRVSCDRHRCSVRCAPAIQPMGTDERAIRAGASRDMRRSSWIRRRCIVRPAPVVVREIPMDRTHARRDRRARELGNGLRSMRRRKPGGCRIGARVNGAGDPAISAHNVSGEPRSAQDGN